MRVGLLGPIGVFHADGELPLGGRRLRALLAVLALSPNETVTEARVLEAVWPEGLPTHASRTLATYVSRLRKVLHTADAEEPRVETRPGGYALKVTPQQLDTLFAEQLHRQATAAMVNDDAVGAGTFLREALALWRGDPLGDLADEPFALPAVTRLTELRLELIEERIEADLACGQHRAVAGELEELTTTHRLREKLWGQRMVALARDGRQAEALRVYQELRTTLAEDLGIEPSPAIREIERDVLMQNERLAWNRPGDAGPDAGSTTVPEGTVRVVLVDDHPLWRTSVRLVVENDGGIAVVGEAADGPEAIEVVHRTSPDVIVMDVDLPGIDGIEAVARLSDMPRPAHVLMLSSSGDDADVVRAIRAGAQGYLLKTAGASEIAEGIRRVAAGHAVLPPTLADVVVQGLRDQSPTPTLGQRQRDVLALVSRGASVAAIAERLGVDEAAVLREVRGALMGLECGGAVAGRAVMVVAFVDIVDSTAAALEMGDRRWRDVLDGFYAAARTAATAAEGNVVKHLGDGVIAIFERPGDALTFGLEMAHTEGAAGLGVRVGMHAGECEIQETDVVGVAVHLASRVVSFAGPGELVVTGTVRDLAIGSGRRFEDLGFHELRGAPGTWALWAVTDDG